MSAAATLALTAEDLLAMPEDGVHRELIRGELREYPMTWRSRRCASAESRIVHALGNWLDQQKPPCGLMVSGEAGFRLARDPETTVGIDVAYVSQEVVDRQSDSVIFEGVPVLAVEILSPSAVKELVDEKIELYLESGVALIWIVDPTFKTVCVYRPDAAPVLYNEGQEIDAEPHLPGFRCRVAVYF